MALESRDTVHLTDSCR